MWQITENNIKKKEGKNFLVKYLIIHNKNLILKSFFHLNSLSWNGDGLFPKVFTCIVPVIGRSFLSLAIELHLLFCESCVDAYDWKTLVFSLRFWVPFP